jgi:predicted O-linked N-acetylglucosamine transferase (SPINDLY family)
MASPVQVAPSPGRDLPLVVADAHWLIAPVPKVASTVLKRLAVIASGRVPVEKASAGETRPALAIHRADLHALPSLTHFSLEQQAALLADAHGLRLAVTRHPAERLLSFWHDKLHLADPAYAPLNGSVQLMRCRSVDETCSFSDFLAFLNENWHQLRSDGHLRPQREWLIDPGLFNHWLDRERLLKDLPRLLEPLLDPLRMGLIRQELKRYDRFYRQRLAKRWQQAYSKDGFAILERLYGDDLQAYNYRLPIRRVERIKPLAVVDVDALVDPLQQLRERHQQIAGLQQQVHELQHQLQEVQRSLEQPPLPVFSSVSSTSWPTHNSPEAGLGPFYELLQSGHSQELLDQLDRLTNHPHQGEIHYLVGLAHAGLGQPEQALRFYESAQERGFLTPYVLFNGANACRALGDLQEALRLFREALDQYPSFSECRHNFALALIDANQPQQAERELRLLLRDQPTYHQAAFCLGNLLRDLRRDREAVEAFRLCLQFAPSYADAWNNLGLTYGNLKNLDQAIACYRQALSIDALFKPSRQNLAQALIQQKEHQDALIQFKLLCELDGLTSQEQVIGLQGQISCLMELNRYEEGLALADAQADRRLQLMARLHVLPVLYETDEQLLAVRQLWLSDAHELYQLLEGIEQDDSVWHLLYAHAWALTNFYLAYQMQDDRPLQELYAGILDRILRPRLHAFMNPLPPRTRSADEPVRVGVISPHLNNHNGSIWCLGWLKGIAGREGYQIYAYNIGDVEDSGTERFAALGVYRHLPLRSDQVETMLQKILDDHLDLLIFTDIGMHAASKIVSVLRLAPIQAQGWGHPVTSGSRTIDYFLSGEGMEAEGNERHYCESLWRLPATGLNYETPLAVHDGQSLYAKFDLPLDRPLLASLQSTFKYVPRNDWVFAEIAKQNPEALIALVGHMGHSGIADRLLRRMRRHFVERGLVLENHLRILPRLDYGDYMGLLAISHHTIDTIDWNGGNSSLQSFSLCCPVVTMPTEFMRGRHTISMLSVLELPELVASDRHEYVAISSQLLQDSSFYFAVKAKIAERKHLLFGDHVVSDGFRDFVDRSVSESLLVGSEFLPCAVGPDDVVEAA